MKTTDDGYGREYLIFGRSEAAIAFIVDLALLDMALETSLGRLRKEGALSTQSACSKLMLKTCLSRVPGGGVPGGWVGTFCDFFGHKTSGGK